MSKPMKLELNPKFEAALKPLSEEEFAQLEANIQRSKHIEPIHTWKDQILDGHHRYKLAHELGIGFEVVTHVFKDEAEAVEWIKKNQAGRRNCSREEILHMIGQEYLEKASKSRPEKVRAHSEHKAESGKTAKDVAKKHDVSPATVRRAAETSKDILGLDPFVQKAYLAGNTGLSRTQVKDLAALSGQKQQALYREWKEAGGSFGDLLAELPKREKGVDYGQCPNCAGTRWKTGDEGVICARCRHPHGQEPSGGADEDRVATQRSKTIKTIQALMRAWDDLQLLSQNGQHGAMIDQCKSQLKVARAWK